MAMGQNRKQHENDEYTPTNASEYFYHHIVEHPFRTAFYLSAGFTIITLAIIGLAPYNISQEANQSNESRQNQQRDWKHFKHQTEDKVKQTTGQVTNTTSNAAEDAITHTTGQAAEQELRIFEEYKPTIGSACALSHQTNGTVTEFETTLSDALNHTQNDPVRHAQLKQVKAQYVEPARTDVNTTLDECRRANDSYETGHQLLTSGNPSSSKVQDATSELNHARNNVSHMHKLTTTTSNKVASGKEIYDQICGTQPPGPCDAPEVLPPTRPTLEATTDTTTEEMANWFATNSSGKGNPTTWGSANSNDAHISNQQSTTNNTKPVSTTTPSI